MYSNTSNSIIYFYVNNYINDSYTKVWSQFFSTAYNSCALYNKAGLGKLLSILHAIAYRIRTKMAM